MSLSKGQPGRLIDLLVAVVAAAIGSFLALLATPQFGRVTSSPAGIGVASVLLAAALAGASGWLIGRRVSRRMRAGVSATLAATVFAALVAWLLREPPSLHPPVTVPADMSFWNLPTGSKIAYRRMSGVPPLRPSPVVFLHGGPGAPVLPMLDLMRRPFEQLQGLGYDVYFYDRYGSGYSSRADLSREAPYTVGRQIEDLEAIRKTIGAEKLILIGTSWGATLAAAYVLRFPDHVERIVCDSPGPLWLPAFPTIDAPDANRPLTADEKVRLDAAWRPTPRIVAGRMLGQVNPKAGAALVKDREVDEWFGNGFYTAIQLGQPRSSCRGVMAAPKEYFRTMGFFVFNFMVEDALRLPDPRPELRRRPHPVLVLRGECDWIKPEVAREYRDVFPSARLVAVPGAAHMTWLEQPDLVQRIVAAFLLDKDLPVPVESGGAAPP